MDTNIEKCVNLLKNISTLFLFILLVPFLKGCVAFWIATKQKSSLHLHQLSQKYRPVQFCRFVAIWKPIFATWLYTFVYDSEEESRCFTAVSTVSKMLPWRAVAFHFVFIFPSVPAFVFLFIHLFPLLDKSHLMLGALLASAQPHSLNIVVFKSRRYGKNRQIWYNHYLIIVNYCWWKLADYLLEILTVPNLTRPQREIDLTKSV